MIEWFIDLRVPFSDVLDRRWVNTLLLLLIRVDTPPVDKRTAEALKWINLWPTCLRGNKAWQCTSKHSYLQRTPFLLVWVSMCERGCEDDSPHSLSHARLMLIGLIIILWLSLTFAAPWTEKIKFGLREFLFFGPGGVAGGYKSIYTVNSHVTKLVACN